MQKWSIYILSKSNTSFLECALYIKSFKYNQLHCLSHLNLNCVELTLKMTYFDELKQCKKKKIVITYDHIIFTMYVSSTMWFTT